MDRRLHCCVVAVVVAAAAVVDVAVVQGSFYQRRQTFSD